MKPTLLALSLLIAATVGALLAQPPAAPQVIHADKATVDAALAKTGLLSRNADHMVAGGRRDTGGVAEQHEKAYDIYYVTDGEAVYVTGGTLKDSKQTGPGEMLGGTIEGGESRQVKVGDVIVVPPGIPHWWKETKGISYLIIKVNKP
jgi:quercetin dioxygenase-like cupin family protein